MRNLITAQEVIDLAFAENSNMMAESISDTAIRIAEIKYIRPAFGVMYPLLADKYADFTNDYVKPALAYFVKCEIVSSIAIDMSNSGVAVANPQYQSAATDKQRQRLYDSEMSKAKTLLDFALEYIATHSEEFPDFSGEAPKKHHRVGGILLGGGTSRSQSASITGEAFKNEIERLSKDVAGKVDKVEGKGLSTNDYTSADKAVVDRMAEFNSYDILYLVTHSELLALKDEGKLIPGAFYRITDYLTTTKQTNTRSAGHPFDIIVQALDSHTLSEDARAIQHEGDTYFAKSNLKAWSLKYALDGDTSRFSWAKDPARPQSWSCAWGVLESKSNSDASSNYEQATIDGKLKYLYRPAEPTSHLQGKQFYRDVVISSITSPDGLIYEADSAPTYNKEEGYYDFPSEIRVKTASGKQVALFMLEYDNYYSDVSNSEYYIAFGSSYEEVNGVYHLMPEGGIEDWWEDCIGGSIEETEQEYYEGSTDNLYYAFDSALPKSSKSVTEVTDKVHIYKTGGTIDTIIYQSYISEEDGGKGVIYQLIDEFGNDCSYDFKNIQFNDNNVYYYTFSSSGNDASLSGAVRDNILMPYSGNLLTTIFKGATIGNKIQRINGSKAFVFEKSATYNDIRATHEDASIYAKGNFDTNVLLIRSKLITNGAFSNNYVQYLSSNTTINGDFYANQLDTLNRNDATLTINCGRIQQCTIYGCGTLSIANTNGATTGTMGYSTINLGMNGSNVKLLWNTTASLNNRIEGLNIKAYNWGTSEVAVDITNHPVNATYPLTIAKNKNGEVKIFCEADLA